MMRKVGDLILDAFFFGDIAGNFSEADEPPFIVAERINDDVSPES